MKKRKNASSEAKIKMAARRHLLGDKVEDMTANIPPQTTKKEQDGADR